MPRGAKLVLRILGTLNATAVLLGTSFVAEPMYRFLRGWRPSLPYDAPYFPFAFVTMTAIELAFASVLLVTAVRFIQARLSAANLYSLTVAALFVYFVVVGVFWRPCLPAALKPVALSVAAATAVSSATLVFTLLFLVPFLYPAISVVLVQLLKRRYTKPTCTAVAAVNIRQGVREQLL